MPIQVQHFLFSAGRKLMKCTSLGVDVPYTTIPVMNSLFFLPLPWLMNQHHLNCFMAACVYFTPTLTFPFLLLPTHTQTHAHTSPQQSLASRLWIAYMHSTWQPLQVQVLDLLNKIKVSICFHSIYRFNCAFTTLKKYIYSFKNWISKTKEK